MTRSRWISAISPFRPPVPRVWHWTGGLTVAVAALAGAVYFYAVENMPDPIDEDAELETMIVSLGAPAQRLEPPPPPPPDVPPPEPEPEPQAPTERAEDAPPPEPPPQPRPVAPPAPSNSRPSSGFGTGTEPAPPPPPKVRQLDRTFIEISTREYVSRVSYPYEALRRNQQGQGQLLVLIDKNGRVLEWSLSVSTGHAILDREIERVAKQVDQLDPLPDDYAFQRARLNIPFNFILESRR